MSSLPEIRTQMRSNHLADETQLLKDLVQKHGLDMAARTAICATAESYVRDIRASGQPGLMEVFLAEYGLSTDEGVALMCLAEALLRVPDAATIDDLIEDKIAPSKWGEHLGKSSSSLVNASTWALMLTGKVLKDGASNGIADRLHGAIKRLGEPVIRTAVKQAMKVMGHQFVLGQTISDAIKRGKAMEDKGYTYSYDMLGEAALTAKDASGFFVAYADAIQQLSAHATHEDIRDNPGISIKLSALHPRYEVSQRTRVMSELVPRVIELALMAKSAGMGLNIDAEEADRLDLSLDVIDAVLSDPRFAGWNGFGVVVQAYGKRAPDVIDWLYHLAERLDRSIMVRLVKGAYWDTEIKVAQTEGLPDFPVYTQKLATDVSYICCARKLLDYSDRIYPQFATHNAHSVSAILHMAQPGQAYEFQRLHGMGEVLHNLVKDKENTRCRIYAPVGAHSDLLAYLVRRLLENGANSSFVNQIVDENVAPSTIAADPFVHLDKLVQDAPSPVLKPLDLYQPERPNSQGWDLRDHDTLNRFHTARETFKTHQWRAGPILASGAVFDGEQPVFNPADPSDAIGTVALATPALIETALMHAQPWNSATPTERCAILNRVADLYEEHSGELFAVLCREAGKTALDAVAEIREAVDFLRYYAAEAIRHGDQEARGIFTCISPWNFPLAIFTGQIAAALAAGNGVIAKPADPTPMTASIAVNLMRQAGVPDAALQLVPGIGSEIGPLITSDTRINGICFTGSTGVAQLINKNAAQTLKPDATFIAETGGLNAMIVDSTALPEQAVKDIVASAFQSAGQRCSALRVLYVQKDIAKPFLDMLYGAMDELELSDPWNMSSDIGPIISDTARQGIQTHVDAARKQRRVLKQITAPETGYFFGPTVIEIDSIQDLTKEIFGPVLHVCTFKSDELDAVIDSINATGYGLTFGLHTRIDDRVEHITKRITAGNLYVNRNQIGAIVGSQPFGGEGLSGTGPKAGGPLYVPRFKQSNLLLVSVTTAAPIDPQEVQKALNAAAPDRHAALETRDLPGPTGESNRWSLLPKGTVLCLGPTPQDMSQQMSIARENGCHAIGIAPGASEGEAFDGFLPREALTTLQGFDAVALWSDEADLRSVRCALAQREGPLVPLIATDQMAQYCVHERHLCIDTTAAGGNAALLAQ